MIRKKESGEVLINTDMNKEHFLISKNTDSLHTMKAPASIYTGNHAPESWSCSSCQTAWAGRAGQPAAPESVSQWRSRGAGLRAAQALVRGARARALLEGRACVELDDLCAIAPATLRHRILVGYRAEAEGVGVGTIIERLMEHVETPRL